MIRTRSIFLLGLTTLLCALASCGGPTKSETLTKEIVVHDANDTVEMDVDDLEGDGVGTAPDVDYNDREKVHVLRYSLVYDLEKTPRDSSDVHMTEARIKLIEPDHVDLTLVENVHVYLLPKRANWYDSSNWRRVAVSHGFQPEQRTADFEIVNRPSDIQRYIHHDDGDDEVWVAFYVVVDDDVTVPQESLRLEVDMDLEISP